MNANRALPGNFRPLFGDLVASNPMPRVDPSDFETLTLNAFELTHGIPLHDVWSVDLAGGTDCSVQKLQSLLTAERLRSLPFLVRALFAIRSSAGRSLSLDGPTSVKTRSSLTAAVPATLAAASLVRPGTPAGAFTTLYSLPKEAAFEAHNATVHAVLVVALVPSGSGHRLYFGTYVESVGRITRFYMGLIDPFRRWIVYPGLESWLARTWREAKDAIA